MIIGSTAIKYHFPNFPREPKDIDFINGSKINDYFPKEMRREYLENPVLLQYCKNDDFLDINSLYTLKISHCLWDVEGVNWMKHMWDVQWLKEKGCVFIPELFNELYKYWETIHGKRKTSNLAMSAEEFFDNIVGFPVEHDYLHSLLVQHEYFGNQNLPMYTKVLKDGAEVDVSEEKFNLLTEKEKFNLVFEEVAVMQLERYGNMYYKKGYNRMLKKFILHHAPLWESIWIIQNHKKLLQNIPFNHLEFLNQKIKQNELQISK